MKLFAEAEDGAELVFPDVRAASNLQTTLEKIIARAGVKQWPKLWQNLRASGATDFARSLPSYIAAEICGHTEQIAKEHYWTISDSDLDQAIAEMAPEISQKLAQKLAHEDDSKGLRSSFDDSTENRPRMRKAQEIPGFDSICRLLSEGGFPTSIGVDGLEPGVESDVNSGANLQGAPSVVASVVAIHRLPDSVAAELRQSLLSSSD